GSTKRSQSRGPAGSTAPAGAFSVVRPQKKSLPKVIEQPGTVQAYESTPRYAKLAGFVKKVYVDIDDVVEGPVPASESQPARPGTLLAELSIPELEDEGRQKEALVEEANAEVEQAKKLVVVADANVVAAEAQGVEARAGARASELSVLGVRGKARDGNGA